MHVVDEQKRPIAGARVRFQFEGKDTIYVGINEKTDENGAYSQVIPDGAERVIITVRADGFGEFSEPKVIEERIASGKRHVQLQLKPNEDNTSARLELRFDSEKPEVSELAIQLGDRPEKQPPVTQLLNPGDSSRLLERTLKSPAGSFRVDLKLLQP